MGALRQKVLRYIERNWCYMISKASFSWNSCEPNSRTLIELKRVVNDFYSDVECKRLHAPDISLLIPYNLFRGMSLVYVPGTDYETKDGMHLIEECHKNLVYETEIKVPFYKRIFGHLFYGIGKMAGNMKGMTVTYKK